MWCLSKTEATKALAQPPTYLAGCSLTKVLVSYPEINYPPERSHVRFEMSNLLEIQYNEMQFVKSRLSVFIIGQSQDWR
jgi:hypothetical protein